MKIPLRVLFSFTVIFIFSFSTEKTMQGQGRIVINDRFASVGEVKLHIAGKARR
jgi:hypothetical protein